MKPNIELTSCQQVTTVLISESISELKHFNIKYVSKKLSDDKGKFFFKYFYFTTGKGNKWM